MGNRWDGLTFADYPNSCWVEVNPEYWIVDPDRTLVTVLTLVDGLYEETVFESDRAIESTTFSHLKLSASHVLMA